MNTETLDSRITGHMGPQGWNYDSDVGGHTTQPKGKNNHPAFTSPSSMGNPANLDPSMPKKSSDNPGVDHNFWKKGDPQMDTTGHGRLTTPTCYHK